MAVFAKRLAAPLCLSLCFSLALAGCARQKSQPAADPSSSQTTNTSAVTVIDGDSVTFENRTFSADRADQNALVVQNGGSAVLRNCTIRKTGNASSSQDGQNAALLVKSGGNLVMENCSVITDGLGADGIAAIGENACAVVSDTEIITKQAYSRGLVALDNGGVLAQYLTIRTEGDYSPLCATRTRGSLQAGRVDGQTSGAHAFCLYAAGPMRLENSSLTARAADGCAVSGSGSLQLCQTTLTGEAGHAVLILNEEDDASPQSTQTALVQIQGGTLSAKQGAGIFATNVQAKISFSDSPTVRAESNVLLRASAGPRGTAGQNGAVVLLDGACRAANIIQTDDISTVTASEKSHFALAQ